MENEGNKTSGNNSSTEPTPQQGIFSSPDLSVNSENLEEIKPELSEGNKSRIASAFAKTDATQKQDQLSEQMAENDAISGTVIPAGGAGFDGANAGPNGFGSAGLAGASNATASTATGDIRLAGVKKKSKLPLVLAALVVLAVVGGVAAWLVLGRKDNNPSQATTPLSATETAFAKYANYLLYGEEKTTFDGEYDSSHSYLLNQQLDAENYDQTYWDEASELLDKTTEALAQADDPAKDQLTNAFNNYRQNFNFVKYYKRTGAPDEDALRGTFMTSGMDGIATSLKDFYAGFSLLNSGAAQAYADQSIQRYTDMMGIYQLYNELGCVQDGVINESACATPSVEQQSRMMNLSESLARNARAASTTLENAVRYVESYCWDLDNWLKNPATLEGEANE